MGPYFLYALQPSFNSHIIKSFVIRSTTTTPTIAANNAVADGVTTDSRIAETSAPEIFFIILFENMLIPPSLFSQFSYTIIKTKTSEINSCKLAIICFLGGIS